MCYNIGAIEVGAALIDQSSIQGVHKHFRMLAIADYLKSQGFGPSTGEHMHIPGIWKKLRTLYNLDALDERVSKPSDPPSCWLNLTLLIIANHAGKRDNQR